jgi:YfiH family protein
LKGFAPWNTMLARCALLPRTLLHSSLSANPEDFFEVPYFQFPRLSQFSELVHAVFTRQGGVSPSPFDTLNTSFSTGDRKERVSTNLKIIQHTVGAKHLTFINQVHGTDIWVLRTPPSEQPVRADALITDVKEVAIMVKQADCQAIILYDPIKGVLANVHCGWRGNARNFLAAVLRRMSGEFGTEPHDLRAAIGPSLGPCCAEFVTHENLFPEDFHPFMVRKNYFDLWQITRWQLREAGLREEHIETAGICTRCRTDLFFSYRARKVTGRFATVAMLR